MRRWISIFLFLLFASSLEAAKAPHMEPKIVQKKINEIMQAHATYKNLNTLIVQRALTNYIEGLDPSKTYFIESDIHQWIEPSNTLLEQVLDDYNHGRYPAFDEIHQQMVTAIQRRRDLQSKVDSQPVPQHVKLSEFKDMKWANSEEELVERILKIKGLQQDSLAKMKEDLRQLSIQRIAKQRASYEDELTVKKPNERRNLILTNALKATALAFDTHTAYFTPAEATQFMIGVQQSLFGIGAQLRDDINGFSIVKMVDGGPALLGKELKAKDRIIAVNNEPVVGMDITDVVGLIRGEEKTPVVLTVVRETGEEKEAKKEEILNITVLRGEVVIKESRYESSYEPYGDGVIAYLRLFSFYQDPRNEESSSAADLAREIKNLKKDHKVNGVVLDLRYNSGGLLEQAVEVASLFITQGVVVSVKDYMGNVQHLRNLDSRTVWDGPLIVLLNRASASASEIVAQALQDYGRAIIVGDDHSYGKGSFQMFTLTTRNKGGVNTQGEYKVTQGRYYTVSGKTPQMVGVAADVVVPGLLSEMEIGEKYAKYPLGNDEITDSFDDDLADLSLTEREKIGLVPVYKHGLQPRLSIYTKYLPTLKKNAELRLKLNKNYQEFLKKIQKKDKDQESDAEEASADSDSDGQVDWQLNETYNVMRDLIILMV
jgi:carboxyl-terminal processing protease